MFLDKLIEQNSSLIEYAVYLHQKGKIFPNTYLFDLDAIANNVQCLVSKADELNLTLFAMTKQFGRNPFIAKKIADSGIDKFVAVDPWEALTLIDNNLKLGNVGHIVQIPRFMLQPIIKSQPEFITVFSVEMAARVSAEAKALDIVQNILLRLDEKAACIYPGQEGGFTTDTLIDEYEQITHLPNIIIKGVTAFPCLLYKDGRFDLTSKGREALKAREILEQTNHSISVLNLPSLNTSSTFEFLKNCGATHLEPGHALLGTTPVHAQKQQPEIPAICYVSEVSHLFDNKAYIYGGGYYPRGFLQKALVGKNHNKLTKTAVNFPPAEFIDYYGSLDNKEHIIYPGDSVICSFRTQVFVTRAQVGIVEGLSTGQPRLSGIYDSRGSQIK